MKKSKLFFANEDECFCVPLEDHIKEAKEDGLKQIELFESVRAKGNTGYRWCTYEGCVVEDDLCKKNQCRYYEKSGNNVCKHRGNYYEFGSKLKFDVETGKEITNETK